MHIAVAELHRFDRVDFHRFKAFNNFSLQLRHFNILIGPNNAGKSTILAAFRILAAALRRASTRRPEIVRGPDGSTSGYKVDLSAVSVAEENIFYNYDDSEAATVRFRLTNGNVLQLYFPEQGVCYLMADAKGRPVLTPTSFRSNFNCPIGFVPILGPVDHNEVLFEKEAARLALFNYRAARNFRNIWYHYPERFSEFRSALAQSWPGMDIDPPRVDYSHDKPRLYMFCPEERIPRELFWAGFGFQVWCQMLTHVIQYHEAAIFLIDEPDIYLHSDLQRQLLHLLRNMGPDILIATHSTEIIVEAETDDLVLVSKQRTAARRIRNPSQLQDVFKVLGSNLNPVLTQLAKTRRVVFVEGQDFQILGRFARKLGSGIVASRREFAVVPIEGFNPERVRVLKAGMEATLGATISAALVLDRDYRSDAECEAIAKECNSFCDLVKIHARKEIENFLLVPTAIDRAATRRVADQAKRAGEGIPGACNAELVLGDFAENKRRYVTTQYLDHRKRFMRIKTPAVHEATINEAGLTEFESRWIDSASRLQMIPGKEAMSVINQRLQDQLGITVTATAIIDAMMVHEVPTEMRHLIESLGEFASHSPK
jgi:energy-coupling factor transporter ATP-binding protein EcfA2